MDEDREKRIEGYLVGISMDLKELLKLIKKRERDIVKGNQT